MKITYDKKADALNIVLKKGIVKETIEVSPEIFVDLDKEGKPLFLEIIGLSEKVGGKNFSNIEIGKRKISMPAFA